jgi:F-type H+-transporting ATPase subunit epsilon
MASSSTFELEVATPEKLVIQATCTEAQVPGADGYLGILPQHAPLLSQLGIGLVKYHTQDGRDETLAVHGGYVEVQPNLVRILTDAAERPDEVDAARAEAALKKAQDQMVVLPPGVDIQEILDAAKRAQARVEAAAAKK